MNQFKRIVKRGLFISVGTALSIIALTPVIAEGAKVNEQINVSDGVIYKDVRYSEGKVKQAVRILEINTKDPYTAVEIGLPSALNRLTKTTTLANKYNWEGHQVVGAINGPFFHLGTPMNLVAKDNQLIHAGEVFPGKDKYVNEPIAFGMNSHGKGIIDHYKLEMSFIHNGESYPITSTNKERSANENILYTSDFPSKTTNTNEWGSEVVITTSSKPTLEFGSTFTGTVASVKRYPEQSSSAIPKNGFVLSGSGIGSDYLKDVNVGDPITLSIDIDSKWKDSSFMLASGPLLVKNGQPSLTMDPNSPNARSRAPRSAVAIDRTGEKVFLVTVDGRQEGYSNGMSVAEFARHLAGLGADRALNLDGGGSTTMAVRHPNKDKVALINRPSDKYERTVSAILMGVSTVPKQLFPDVKYNHWALSFIEELYERGTITGYPDGTFKPEESISRQLIALMLAREYNLDITNVTNPNFKDVSIKDTYYREIAAVVNAGLFIGKDDGRFGKEDYLTRSELAVVLQRAYEFEVSEKDFFSDIKNDKYYAYDAINSLADRGIIDGYPDGTFKPDNPVSRAMFSKLLAESERLK